MYRYFKGGTIIMFQLRDYQQECVDICNSKDEGSYLIHLATSLGKTVIFSSIKRRGEGRVLILAHRKEIIEQAQKYYDEPVGIEMAEQVSHGENVIAGNIMSMRSRYEKFPKDYFDVIITDEAHHAIAPSYRKIYEYFDYRVHFGFTATPQRGDHIGLASVFDEIIFSHDMQWGIKNKWMCDLDCYQVEIGYDLKHVKKGMTSTGKDFVAKDLAEVVNHPEFNKRVAEAYVQYHQGQTLLFAASVQHAWELHKLIPESSVVDGTTPKALREQTLLDFKEGKVKCLINNLVFTEGTDIPEIDTLLIARPTQNMSLYEQMVGRGVRLREGKEYCRLIDCTGLNAKQCTAPTLFGIEPEDIPKRARQKVVQGLLSEVKERLQQWNYTPVAIALRATHIPRTDPVTGYNYRDIAWNRMEDGSYILSGKGYRWTITDENDLGRANLIILERREMQQNPDKYGPKWRNVTYRDIPVQQLFDYAAWFIRNSDKYREQQYIWDADRVTAWSAQQATGKQIELLRNGLSQEDGQALIQEFGGWNAISKYQASVLINNMFSSQR